MIKLILFKDNLKSFFIAQTFEPLFFSKIVPVGSSFSPIYLYLIFAILVFEISSLTNWIFQTGELQQSSAEKLGDNVYSQHA